jgi:capsular polysaccharide biosynthesis protein
MEKKMAFIEQQSDPFQHKNMQSETSPLPLEWVLPHERVPSVQAFSKIRHIDPLPFKKHDTATTLRNTWFGRIYTNYLKQYAIIRLIFHWIWRNGYPLYVNHLSALLSKPSKRHAIRWRPLIELNTYAKKKRTPIFKLADESVVYTPEPKVFPSCDQGCLSSPHDRFKFPEIYVAVISNGLIYGGTNLVLSDGKVICHDLYDFKRDYTSEELHGRTLIHANSKRIRWLLHDEEPERIPAAAAFVDACAPNYAHWLTEVLPRVALFCADERFTDIPIVVNQELHKNIMESLFMVTGPEREVILLPIGRGLHCDKLYFTSASGYVPFEWRKNKTSDCPHGMFSPAGFDMLRRNMNEIGRNIIDQDWPEKIFLRRNSGYRIVGNANEIEKLFYSNGFVIVEPEKLTFSQQVVLFNNAKVIVSATGAALANIIFAPHDAKIFILISKHPDTIYWYWQNIACVSGKTVSYVFGKISDSGVNGIHASYTVDLDDLKSLISEVER